MNGFYYALDIIKDQLELDNDVNVVNTGIIEDVLLKKKDIYPYSHILVNNATLNGSTWTVSYSVICMDIVDISKEQTTDIFRGQNNVQDVLNTQFVVINRVLEVLRRGENTHLYQLDGSPNCEPFEDRFEHGVAGWTVTFDLLIPNDMTVCATDVAPVKLCPDFEYTITDADSNVLYTGDILSGNSLVQLISNATVTNSLATVLGTVLAQGTIELADVDNIDSDGSTVPTPAGVAFTCTPSGVCSDGTVNVNKSDGTLISAVTVASGDTEPYNVADSTAVLKDTDGNTLSTTSIKATESGNIEAPDSIVNINSVLWDNVLSGGTENISVRQSTGTTEVGSKQGQYYRIADSDITLNGGAFLSVKAEDGQDIELVDQDDAVITPLSIVGNKITVDIPSGGASVGATLMKTAQVVSYRVGDDADTSSEGRETDFLTLASNNPFGNTFRFTDDVGTQIFANDIVIDWSTFNGTTVLGWRKTASVTIVWNDAIDESLTLVIAGFTNWRVPNRNEIFSLGNPIESRALNYFPFNNTSNYYFWSSTTQHSILTNAFALRNQVNGSIDGRSKTAGATVYYAVRTFTVTGTTLT